MTLTLQQRARRATTRRNNQTAARYPLFAAQFAVTVESQVARLTHQDAGNEAYFARLRAASHAAYQRGVVIRTAVQALAPAAQLAERDAAYLRWYGPCVPEEHGHRFADFWWHAAKKLIPTWVQAHCLNAHFHRWELYQRAGQCPTCGRALTL